MTYTNTHDIIIKLKAIKNEKQLSYSDILELMEKNGDYISRSTLSRVFAEKSEEKHFKYEETIRPIAKVLLDIETIEENDTIDVQAMKTILKYKIERIQELEEQISKLNLQLEKEQLKYHEKLEKEREQSRRSIDFLKNQIELKDKRMDLLFNSMENFMKKCDKCSKNKNNKNKGA